MDRLKIWNWKSYPIVVPTNPDNLSPIILTIISPLAYNTLFPLPTYSRIVLNFSSYCFGLNTHHVHFPKICELEISASSPKMVAIPWQIAGFIFLLYYSSAKICSSEKYFHCLSWPVQIWKKSINQGMLLSFWNDTSGLLLSA